jgi:hypothetical protein
MWNEPFMREIVNPWGKVRQIAGSFSKKQENPRSYELSGETLRVQRPKKRLPTVC